MWNIVPSPNPIGIHVEKRWTMEMKSSKEFPEVVVLEAGLGQISLEICIYLPTLNTW